MIDIAANIESVKERIASACQRMGRSPSEIAIVAVTKTVEPAVIATVFRLGIRHFGESRVQEAEDKINQLACLEPKPSWHMVGHLQSNKVKTAVKLFDIIQSVDSIKLAQTISHLAEKPVPVLLQVNVSAETSKYGFSVEEVESALETISRLPRVEVKGLMTIAPLVTEAKQVRPVFRKLRLLRDSLSLEHLSMGMTDDFEVAVEEGATVVRIGRAIFGERRE